MDAASKNDNQPLANVQAFSQTVGLPQDYPNLVGGDTNASKAQGAAANHGENSGPAMQATNWSSAGGSSDGTAMGYPLVNAVVGPQFCFPYAANFELVRTAGHMSGADWNISESVTGNLVFRVKGRSGMHSHGEMELVEEATGKSLVHVCKKKRGVINEAWHMYCGNDSDKIPLCDVRRTSQFPNSTPSMDVFLHANRFYGATPDFHVEGKHKEKHVLMYSQQLQFAEVSRKANVSKVLSGKDTFEMKVFPGGDHAFAIALVVIMDEMYLHETAQKVVLGLAIGAAVGAPMVVIGAL